MEILVLTLSRQLQLFSLPVQVWEPPQVLLLELEVLAWQWLVLALLLEARVYGPLVLVFLVLTLVFGLQVLAWLLPVQVGPLPALVLQLPRGLKATFRLV